MNEGLQQRSGDRQSDVAAAGPADTAALPDFARFGGAFTIGGEFPINGVLAGSLGIKWIRKDFPIFCFARRTQRKTGTKMKAQRRKSQGLI